MIDHFDDDPIEGYCVRCKERGEIEEPRAVWTRKGMPATRGICPVCGGTIFRMGRTHLHQGQERPAAVQVKSTRRKQPRLPPSTVYIIYAKTDEKIAQQIAADLEKVGVQPWLHEHESEEVAWAGGVHPALEDCDRMIYVLSPASIDADALAEGWQFFKANRKPIIIAQVGPTRPPDAIRRSPRFDFTIDYKRAFREMIQALG